MLLSSLMEISSVCLITISPQEWAGAQIRVSSLGILSLLAFLPNVPPDARMARSAGTRTSGQAFSWFGSRILLVHKDAHYDLSLDGPIGSTHKVGARRRRLT